MTLFHAVVFIDHNHAQVLQFDAEHVQAEKVKASSRHTKQHGSQVRTEHEFFSHVCDALQEVPEILLTGPKMGLADFRHYIEKHRPSLVQQVAGYETVDHPSDNQLVALARKYFLKYDRMEGTPSPM